MEETNPVEETPITPEAGQEKEQEPQTPEQEPNLKSDIDAEAVASLIEEGDKALAAAEKKIVHLKRRLKEGGMEDDSELRNQVESLQNEIAELKGRESEDADTAELTKLRKRNSELVLSLRAKAAISNNSSGTNQSPMEIEKDPTKGYSRAELTILQRVADRKGLSIKEYLKTVK